MDAKLLTNLGSLHDVRALFATLGYTPVREDGEDPVTVARWARFRVRAVADSAPRERARTEARRLSLVGECAMVVVLDPRRTLVLAAPSPAPSGTSRLLAIDLANPDRALRRVLDDLRPSPTSSSLAHAIRVAGILGTEAVGERFFAAFRTTLERMAGSLDGRHSLADRRLATLISLVRVLFLYFVQEKGWLDRRRDFLITLLDDALVQRRHFHSRFLEPLFFGTLNRPLADRPIDVSFGEVPYLNGGLFEPHPLERRIDARFPNAQWRDAFDGLFQRFRFCVREDDEVNAVAPDMLGRVFERLMAPEDRLDSGTYYTPEPVVRQLVEAAVETAFARLSGLDEATSARLVRRHELDARHRHAAQRGFEALTVLDPAAGSGAFLLGALECLAEIQHCLSGTRDAVDRSKVKRRVLRHHLFGVDLNPLAVRLAELRLWLAVVADDPAEHIAHVTPLPNLNGIVRQGDSLFDPLANPDRTVRPSARVVAARAEVEAARRRVFAAHGSSRAEAVEAHARAEHSLAGLIIAGTLVRLDHEIRDLRDATPRRDLFGAPTHPAANVRGRLRTAKQRRIELGKALRALEEGALPFCSFDVQAPEVMARGGFAVVVGNPPWVRAERLNALQRDRLRDRFGWWRSDGGRGYHHLPDLAVAFLERGLELAAPGGAVGMLVPSKIATAGYGERARSHMVRETRIAYVHRVPDREAQAFGATTYPLAVVLEKRPPSRDGVVKLTFEGQTTLRQARLAERGPWILVPDRWRDALEEFQASGKPLSLIAPPALGLKTGADEVFVGEIIDRDGPLARVRFGTGEATIETCMLRPAVRGRDVRRFRAIPARWLLWTHDRAARPRASLPDHAARYLAAHHARLVHRADYRAAKPWCVFRVGPASAPHRVVWRDLTRRPAAVYLDADGAGDAVPLNTCYVAAAADDATAHICAAVLNSTWTSALVRTLADEARGGYRRMNARVAGAVPVPLDSAARAPLVQLSKHLHRHGTVCDSDLDDAVADALGLTARARSALRALAAHPG